ncbi:hypothetical protein [Prevotella sp. HUN102]|uniref:hypothetical protein n=1 Tax=Prevotella sp. HUN102 TaxID=1392486 RepID=UPI00068DBBE9|nr:hypothetical protein [Prevotella sp. HUN102]
MEKNDKIELRSEKVRNIIGEIPPTVVRYGILCIALTVIGLLAAISTLPWPETVNASIVALDENQAILSVPYRYVNDIKPGMKASVAFEGYNAEDFGYKEGRDCEHRHDAQDEKEWKHLYSNYRHPSREVQDEEGDGRHGKHTHIQQDCVGKDDAETILFQVIC